MSIAVPTDAADRGFSLAGGPLLPDSYTLTLRSADESFKDLQGDLLDGDDNGTPGRDYTTTFDVLPFARPVAVAECREGPDGVEGAGEEVATQTRIEASENSDISDSAMPKRRGLNLGLLLFRR